mgnify:CR=1 FL=1
MHPFALVGTHVKFGLDLIYNENPNTCTSALYSVALGMAHREGRKSLNDLGGNKLFQKISEIGIDLRKKDSIFQGNTLILSYMIFDMSVTF